MASNGQTNFWNHSNQTISNESNFHINCSKHDKPFDYYCEECGTLLCGDCLFEQLISNSEEHKTHKIIKTTEMKEKAILNLDESLTKLNDSLKFVNERLEYLENMRAQLSTSYDETQMDMFSTFRSIQTHLSEVETNCETHLMNSISTLYDLSTKAEFLVSDSSTILNSSESSTISAAPVLIERIRTFVSQFPTFSHIEHPRLEWTNELCPGFDSYHLKIQDFIKSFNSRTFTEKYSRVVTRYNGQWRVKLVRSEGDHLGAFLELLGGISSPAPFEYQIEVVHPSSGRRIVKSFRSVFGSMDSWGWKKVASARQLEREGYVDSRDTLCLCVKLRPVSFLDAAKIGDETLLRLKEKYHNMKHG